jgi:pseudouridine synthase
MTQQGQEGERLARFLARAGVASRRHAEQLIAAGRVQVNGQVVTAQGTKVHPEQDRVTVDGNVIQAPTRMVYVMLHKPVGYVTTMSDPQGRPTVRDLLSPELLALRVYPVGRLDIDTSGLLLLTNDGDFALRVAHPRYSLGKHYVALVEGHPSPVALERVRGGVDIPDGHGRLFHTSPAQVRFLRAEGANSRLALTIHEGRKRQVRYMLGYVGHPVIALQRVGIGQLELGNLPAGKWRYLTDEEVSLLV